MSRHLRTTFCGSLAAASTLGVMLTPLMAAPAHAAAPLWLATEMSQPIDAVKPDKCAAFTTRDNHAIATNLPAGSKVERVVEGPMTGRKSCGGRFVAYQINNGQWFGASADTVDKAPTTVGNKDKQIRIVARWDSLQGRHAIADKVVDRKRSGKAMKKDDVGYHLTGVWKAGMMPNQDITISSAGTDTVFDAVDLPASTPDDEGIAPNDTVTMQFVPNDGTAS